MFIWALLKREAIFKIEFIKPSVVAGLLMLLVGNGIVIWVEQFLESGLVAILVSSAPLWFVILDKPQWKNNLNSKTTILGLIIGFGGVLLLFCEKILSTFNTGGQKAELVGLVLLLVGSMSWAIGSLYSKYNSAGGSATISVTWQMLAAGIAFFIISLFQGEVGIFRFSSVSTEAFLSMLYLILFGSIAAFSAYVWLLEVRPATQVSTYAYVNPVVAVLLGVFLAGESISVLQISGLVIILTSVLLVNISKYKPPKGKGEKHLKFATEDRKN